MLNTSVLAAAAAPLATLTAHATLGVRRRRDTLRLKLPAESLSPQVEHDAVEALIRAGAQVRVLRRAVIWCPSIRDGAVVWTQRRARVDRKDWTTIEIAL